MHDSVRDIFTQELDTIRQMGTYKEERVIQGPQAPTIRVGDREVLNFCANNYLGLSSHPQVMEAARHGLEQWGYGLSSVRFICGTQQLHKQLEQKLTEFLGTEDTILYSSCFDANIGLFSALLGPEDTVISDKLNHASIIDGIRLCKARREIYANSDMDQLESLLRGCSDCRIKLIATDGVFSVDGYIARLDAICDLADRYDALVMVDDSHATGFIGSTGRGTAEHYQVMERVDIITSTLGKALGGASGGFTSGRAEIVELLRQRSRPYLFSNSVTPSIAAAAMAALELVSNSSELRDTLRQNTAYFREAIEGIGLRILSGTHPIVPIMIGDAYLASQVAADLLDEGIYVIGFSYPAVPQGEARIRVQISAAHSRDELDRALQAFEAVGRKRELIRS